MQSESTKDKVTPNGGRSDGHTFLPSAKQAHRPLVGERIRPFPARFLGHLLIVDLLLLFRLLFWLRLSAWEYFVPDCSPCLHVHDFDILTIVLITVDGKNLVVHLFKPDLVGSQAAGASPERIVLHALQLSPPQELSGPKVAGHDLTAVVPTIKDSEVDHLVRIIDEKHPGQRQWPFVDCFAISYDAQSPPEFLCLRRFPAQFLGHFLIVGRLPCFGFFFRVFVRRRLLVRGNGLIRFFLCRWWSPTLVLPAPCRLAVNQTDAGTDKV